MSTAVNHPLPPHSTLSWLDSVLRLVYPCRLVPFVAVLVLNNRIEKLPVRFASRIDSLVESIQSGKSIRIDFSRY